MNYQEARHLTRRIHADRGYRVTGRKRYPPGPYGGDSTYDLTVQDLRTGYSFTVRSADDWLGRVDAAKPAVGPL